MEKSNDPFDKKPEKDKEIIDLTDELPSSEGEDDIIDLSDTVDSSALDSDDDILDLTEPVSEDASDEDEVLDLLDAVEPEADQEAVLDLTEPIAQETPDEDDVLVLMDAVEPEADQEAVLDLTEPIAQEAPDEDEVLDLLDAAEPEADQEEVLDLTQPLVLDASDEDDVLDFMDADAHVQEDDAILDLTDLDQDSLEDAISSTEQTEGLEPEPEDHVLDLTEAADAVEVIPEAASPVTVPGPSDDQEILDLIDDIQSTLDDTDGAAEEPAIEERDLADESLPADAVDDASGDQTILVGNGDPIGEDEMVETEPDLVDNLGIDLTSELNRDILEDEDEAEPAAGQQADIPLETADHTMAERIEAIVERVLQEKLETMIGQRIEEAVLKEFEKLRKDILD